MYYFISGPCTVAPSCQSCAKVLCRENGGLHNVRNVATSLWCDRHNYMEVTPRGKEVLSVIPCISGNDAGQYIRV